LKIEEGGGICLPLVILLYKLYFEKEVFVGWKNGVGENRRKLLCEVYEKGVILPF